MLDDLRGVAPRFKLVAQGAAALIVVAYGFRPLEFALTLGGGSFSIGWLSVPLAVVWIVGVTNAFNLIDGVDGLAGSFALIGLGACVVADLLFGSFALLIPALLLIGALVAFLKFNSYPARIFLGDSGSMTIGFFLAVMSVVAGTGPTGIFYALIPLAALAFPITDTLVAIARRWLRGQPLSRADGRHVHHQLLALGLSPVRTVQLLAAIFAGFAVVGLSIVFAPPELTFALLIASGSLGVAILVYGIHSLRYSEFLEFGRSLSSVVRSARTVVQHKLLAEELTTRIERAASLDEICRLLDEYAGAVGLVQVELLTTKSHLPGPESQMIAPADALPWRLDYRLGLGDPVQRELLLRVWCSALQSGAPHGSAERFVVRVGPAIDRWIKSNGSLLLDVRETESHRADALPKTDAKGVHSQS